MIDDFQRGWGGDPDGRAALTPGVSHGIHGQERPRHKREFLEALSRLAEC